MTCAARRCRGCSECGHPMLRGEAKDSLNIRLECIGREGAEAYDEIAILNEIDQTEGWGRIPVMPWTTLRRLAEQNRKGA